MSADDPLTPEEKAAAAVPPEPDTYPVLAEFMAGINLIIPDNLLRLIALDIKSSSFDANIVAYLADLEFYQKAASELFPNIGEVNESIAATSTGFLELPKKHNNYTFLFSKLKMHWDPDYQSFITSEDKNGVASIAGEPINKILTCHVECKMPTNEDDRLYIYLKSPSELWYYFGFKQGILEVVSNNTKFMDELLKLKPKDLIQKMPDGETFELLAAEPGIANQFLRRMKASRQK